MLNDLRIFLVEDDVSQRESIESFLKFKKFKVQSFSSANEFLAFSKFSRPSILICDIAMPEVTGIELYKQLSNNHLDIPVIFISGESSIQQSIDAMKINPIEFLVKPFDINELLIAIEKAYRAEIKKVTLNNLLKTLSPREKEVYNYLIQGFNNNELTEKMNISIPTVKQYKSEVMRKLGINSLSQLIDLSH